MIVSSALGRVILLWAGPTVMLKPRSGTGCSVPGLLHRQPMCLLSQALAAETEGFSEAALLSVIVFINKDYSLFAWLLILRAGKYFCLKEKEKQTRLGKVFTQWNS